MSIEVGNDLWQKMDASKLILRSKAPFFVPMLLTCRISFAPVQTMCVTKGAQVLCDPEFIRECNEKEIAGVLAHECWHLWQRHHERCQSRNRVEWNAAADRAGNPGVISLGMKLPTGCLFPSDIGMPDGLTAEAYYNAQIAKGNWLGKGEVSPCGSGAGHTHPAEAEHADPGDERTEIEVERASSRTAEAILEAAESARSKGRGLLPAGWVRMAHDILAPAKVPWGSLLFRAVRRAVTYRPGAVTPRYDMPSRRQSAIGHGTGVPVLPRMRTPSPIIAVMIDTSGSMSSAQLSDAMRETVGIMSAVGADVHLITCDAEVHGIGKVHSVDDVKKLMRGGGGTDFRPAFNALTKLKPKPEICIFISDCEGPFPPARPVGTSVIVVRVGGRSADVPNWAEVIDYDGI